MDLRAPVVDLARVKNEAVSHCALSFVAAGGSDQSSPIALPSCGHAAARLDAPAGVGQEPARLRRAAVLGRHRRGRRVADATITFIAFCAISSAGYLFNDLRDGDHDRLHPEKRNRPIANGALRLDGAVAALVLAAGALALGFAVEARGRRPGRPLRRDHDRLLAGPEAPGDHRRDDDRLPLHPPGRRRSGRRRGPGVRVPAGLHRLARPLPRLHQTAPGSDVGGQHREHVPPAQRSGDPGEARMASRPGAAGSQRAPPGVAAGPRALLPPVPRPDDRDGHRRLDHLAT